MFDADFMLKLSVKVFTCSPVYSHGSSLTDPQERSAFIRAPPGDQAQVEVRWSSMVFSKRPVKQKQHGPPISS